MRRASGVPGYLVQSACPRCWDAYQGLSWVPLGGDCVRAGARFEREVLIDTDEEVAA
jgi:hypothetical protein